MFQKILVPMDGTPLGERALAIAAPLARKAGAELVLVRVAEPPLLHVYKDAASLFGYEVIAEQARARHYLQMMAGDPCKRDSNAATRSWVGDAASGIVATAHEANADVIVMATHGRGGLARVLLGSVAAEVMRRAETPVMLSRPAALQHRTEATRRRNRPAYLLGLQQSEALIHYSSLFTRRETLRRMH